MNAPAYMVRPRIAAASPGVTSTRSAAAAGTIRPGPPPPAGVDDAQPARTIIMHKHLVNPFPPAVRHRRPLARGSALPYMLTPLDLQTEVP